MSKRDDIWEYRPGGSTWGTSRDLALRPAATFRWLMLVPLAVFTSKIIHRATDLVAGQPVTNPVGLAVETAVFLTLTYVSLRLWTTHIWVQHSFEPGSTMYHQWTLNKTQFGRHTKAHLRSPHTLSINAPIPFGARPSWRLTTTDPDGNRSLTCSAPWVTELGRLLDLLRPVAAGDHRLLADDGTRELVFGNHPGRRR